MELYFKVKSFLTSIFNVTVFVIVSPKLLISHYQSIITFFFKSPPVYIINWFAARAGVVHISGICIWPWTLHFFLHVGSGINLFRQGIKSYWLSPRWNGQTLGRYVWDTGPYTQRRGHWAANNPPCSHWKNWQFTALLPWKANIQTLPSQL